MKITVTTGADEGREITVDREMLIGRVEPADVVIVDPRVSARHAVLRPSGDGVVIEDVGSSNGTLVNGERLTGPRTLAGSDEITVGDTRLRVEGAAPTATVMEDLPSQATLVPPVDLSSSAPDTASSAGDPNAWNLSVRTGPDAGLERSLRDGEQLFIGRDEASHITLTDSRVSNQHAAVQIYLGQPTVRDLGSANGTLLNGTSITGPVTLTSGSEIQVGETVIVATLGVPEHGGPTPTVIGKMPESLTQKPKRSTKALVGATVAGALVMAGGITAGVLALGGGDDKPLTTADIVRANRAATVLIFSSQNGELASSGSGFVIDAKEGLIVTNNHVATGGDLSVQAEAKRDEKVPAKIVAALPCEDLALIKIEDDDVKTALRDVTFATTPFEQGDTVVALGYPGSAESATDPERNSLSATAGIVSKVDTRYDVPRSGVPILTSSIQHTAAVNPGNSGGPLFDDRGEFVGINTAIFGTARGRAEGENYAVSVKRLRERLDLLKVGDSQRWLGIGLGSTLTLDDGREVGLGIDGISPDSPADDANIPAGFVILEIDGKRILDIQDYCDAVPEKEGEEVRLLLGEPSTGNVSETTVTVGSDG